MALIIFIRIVFHFFCSFVPQKIASFAFLPALDFCKSMQLDLHFNDSMFDRFDPSL